MNSIQISPRFSAKAVEYVPIESHRNTCLEKGIRSSRLVLELEPGDIMPDIYQTNHETGSPADRISFSTDTFDNPSAAFFSAFVRYRDGSGESINILPPDFRSKLTTLIEKATGVDEAVKTYFTQVYNDSFKK